MEDKLNKIKAFVFDVDGVLTDGGILATTDGKLLRVFDAKDAFGLRVAAMNGYILGAITGGRAVSIKKRLMMCGFKEEDIYLGSRIKINDFNSFCTNNGLTKDEVMYFGDDIPDIPVLQECGVGVCPNDATEEAKQYADHISAYPGGRLCVRHTIEMVLKHQNKWIIDFEQYNAQF